MSINQQIKQLYKELGERTEALARQAPYAHLSESENGIYNMIKGRIHSIEFWINFYEDMETKRIERENAPVMQVNTDCLEYDSHLGTGMDTSIDINQFEIKE